ncbi:MAG: redox-regulated ATPase YchF [Patescibacteria group bacterium]
MSLSLGIVGLPNVGKSTLFNALTRSKQANVANYPFCTIDPNVGVVEVPDNRLKELADVSKSKKVVPTAIEFVDIAGLVKGASEGEGLGNKFLSHIRETDAIVQVVRAFTDKDITHVHNRVDPREDTDVINLELALADLQTVTKQLESVKKNAKAAAAKESTKRIAFLERLLGQLQAGEPVRGLEFVEDEMGWIKELQLLTAKPMLYVLNVDEAADLQSQIETLPQPSPTRGGSSIAVCAKLEAELAELSPEDAKAYMQELGMTQTGLDKLIVAGYELLNLITYFTSGEPETRAWTIPKGTKAPEAAGVIHTDFVKGFVKADVCNWQEFVTLKGWPGVRENGKLRLEGKEYVVQDGDTCYFHIA